ncbi:restriction endonuclease subunit S [Glutamicibacter mishrai]|uniref:restriction endonuclease subunit S n=1 Tax=Glutamicibacter mishrai TaxID=1775880 RepID=UPI0020CC144A|nr:restriction endonuclease subunit S [Glutamicibacter mishrai]UTT40475.1 restriction endonuclease subunit S [Glutamicibacter mishrai]
MSRIDELITELCPNGVPVHRLGEIATMLRGNGMPKTMLLDAGVGAIHYGQIYTKYGTWAEETLSFVSDDDAKKLTKAEPGDLIITNTSENLEDVGKAVAWLGESQIVTGGHATVIKHKFEPKFLAYWFQTPDFYMQKKKLATGTKVIDVSAKKLEQVIIPVPPLEIQREIVRILDTFSKMEAELEAELEARKQQYEHYRHSTFETSESVPHVPLGNLTRIKTGSAVSKRAIEDNPGQYPVINSGREPLGFIGTFNTENDPIGVTSRGAGVGSITWCNEPYFRGNLNYAVTIRDQKTMVVRYLFHALNHLQPEIQGLCTFQGIPALNKSNLEKLLIPVPSIDEQQRIVGFLDQLDSFVNDLSIGLPAELVARRQQYKYYRDKLLTFKELEPAV